MKCYDVNLLSIDRLALKLFLERSGEPRPIAQNDLDNILRRYDKDGDDCISYEEFEGAILPSEYLKKPTPEVVEEVDSSLPLHLHKGSPCWRPHCKDSKYTTPKKR